jgi:ribosomal protein S11
MISKKKKKNIFFSKNKKFRNKPKPRPRYRNLVKKLRNRKISKKYLKRFATISIVTTQNNIFLTFSHRNRVIISKNTGSLKIKTSQKTVRTVFFLVVPKFLDLIKKYIIQKNKKIKCIKIILTLPTSLKSKGVGLIGSLMSFFKTKKTNFLIKVKSKKSFNGCRPKKKQRLKKRFFDATKKISKQ